MNRLSQAVVAALAGALVLLVAGCGQGPQYTGPALPYTPEPPRDKGPNPRVALVGNIFMPDLVYKEPSDIDSQVRERIQTIGAGGGYIISSSNSLTDDMKPENVRAMIDAIARYGAS